MHRFRTLLATSLVAALAIGALAAPGAAATKGKMALVNGAPGLKIDVCVGTNEIRSNLPYGGVYKKKLIGVKKLRFRKASPGRCKGALLAAKSVRFPSGSDKTIVVTRKLPKVLVFDNANLGIQPAEPDAALAVRHAADLSSNSVFFEYRLWQDVGGGPLPPTISASPAASAPHQKGDQYAAGFTSTALRFQALALREDGSTVIRESGVFTVDPLRRYEIYLVGTSGLNSKMVRVTSALASPPAPAP